MRVLGVIPARGGSKRVPRKNVLPLCGKPLIAYTIEAAKNAKLLSDVIVSTDDEEIKEVAIKHGGSVPFIRPSDLAGDSVGDLPVLRHAVEKYESSGNRIDAVALLRPTSPFKTSEVIDEVIGKLDPSHTSIRSVSVSEGIFHPYWMFKEKDGLGVPVVEGASIKEYYQSQLLPPVYRLNGVVDVIMRDTLFDEKEDLYGDRMAICAIADEFTVDIDTPEDFEFAEWKMSRK